MLIVRMWRGGRRRGRRLSALFFAVTLLHTCYKVKVEEEKQIKNQHGVGRWHYWRLFIDAEPPMHASWAPTKPYHSVDISDYHPIFDHPAWCPVNELFSHRISISLCPSQILNHSILHTKSWLCQSGKCAIKLWQLCCSLSRISLRRRGPISCEGS